MIENLAGMIVGVSLIVGSFVAMVWLFYQLEMDYRRKKRAAEEARAKLRELGVGDKLLPRYEDEEDLFWLLMFGELDE